MFAACCLCVLLTIRAVHNATPSTSTIISHLSVIFVIITWQTGCWCCCISTCISASTNASSSTCTTVLLACDKRLTWGQRLLSHTTGKVKKVKASHTRYRALGPELIPVYRPTGDLSHPPSVGMPLAARPAVTFLAAEHHRHLAGTHFTVPRRVESWVDLGGQLHIEIKCRLRESNPDTVTHPSTNRARRRLTSLIETINALPLRQTATLQVGHSNWSIKRF